MVNADTAKKLRDAGLKRKLEPGDFFRIHYESTGYVDDKTRLCYECYCEGNDEYLWLPRLDQLLKKLDEMDYGWCFEHHGYFQLFDANGTMINTFCEGKHGEYEESAAAALLWILEKAND